MQTEVLIRAAEVARLGTDRAAHDATPVIRDVRCQAGRIVAIEKRLAPRADEARIDAEGAALLPGLHDHHLHLNALAASLDSVPCGPPEVETRQQLAGRLRRASPSPNGWLRGTGYFESVAGDLDRHALDQLRDDVPVRVQHRSGAMWFLNSRGIERLGLNENSSDRLETPIAGETTEALADRAVERDAAGHATGRLFRADDWLRQRQDPDRRPPDLARVGRRLASFGVTGVTDATPHNSTAEAAQIARAQASGALPQRVRLMGRLALTASAERLSLDAYKIMLDEAALPDFDRLVARIRAARAEARCVAVHTVTRATLHFALAALEAAGTQPGDRLEHASVAPREAVEQIARMGLSVVTQPNFIAERGDDYLTEVDPRDRASLYRVAYWIERGVPLAAGTDAPFGDADPWRAMRAAVERRTRRGRVLGGSERVDPETALALFDGTPWRPVPRSPARGRGRAAGPGIAVGHPADLCLLDRPWHSARGALSSRLVRATLVAGRAVYGRV